MANNIPDPDVAGQYYTDYANGNQTTDGTNPYDNYPTHLDTNFVTLRDTVNQINTELRSLSGQNAPVADDLVLINDLVFVPEAPIDFGRIGKGSYWCTTTFGASNQINVGSGAFMLLGNRVVTTGQWTLTALAGAGTYWVVLDPTEVGVPSLVQAGVQPSYAIAGAIFDGTFFTAAAATHPTEWEDINLLVSDTPAPAMRVFSDGDDFYRAKSRREAESSPSQPGVWPNTDYTSISSRITAIERLIAGESTDLEGQTIGPLQLSVLPPAGDGSLAAPSYTFVNNTNSGIWRDTATGGQFQEGDDIRISTNSIDRGLRVSADGGVHEEGKYEAAVEASGDTTGGSVGSPLPITFDNVLAATPPEWLVSWAGYPTPTSGDRLTAPAAGGGFYYVECNVSALFSAKSTEFQLELWKNGANLTNFGKYTGTSPRDTGASSAAVTAMVDLDATDYVEAAWGDAAGTSLDAGFAVWSIV